MNRRRIGVGVLLAFLFVGGGFTLRNLLRSDEDRIRSVLETMVRRFNAPDPGDIGEGFSEDFEEEGSGLGREDLERGMLFLARTAGRPFPYQVHLDEEDLLILVDGDEATAEGAAVFDTLRGSEWTETWRMGFRLEFRKDNGTWRVYRATTDTQSGRRPF
ncbi:MAG TPA: DUF4440 domain-containing protein [Planctomycetes bacterium]|nr:DUF4440 domain-containing protein [Planctomycetota bacterium]